MPARADHLGPVVDAECQARGRLEGSEILDPIRGRPQEGARLACLRLREAHDLPTVVHVVGDARRAAQAPEVQHPARLWDDEGVFRPRHVTVPDDLAVPVDRQRFACAPAQRTEVEARALGKEVGMVLAERGVAATDDIAPVANVVRRRVHAGERFQVYDSQILLPEERPGATQAVATRAHHLASPVHRLGLAHRAPQRAKLAHRDYRRPSCLLAHRPAWTAVSAVGPSKRCTRMAARPLRLTATMWKIET